MKQTNERSKAKQHENGPKTTTKKKKTRIYQTTISMHRETLRRWTAPHPSRWLYAWLEFHEWMNARSSKEGAGIRCTRRSSLLRANRAPWGVNATTPYDNCISAGHLAFRKNVVFKAGSWLKISVFKAGTNVLWIVGISFWTKLGR